MIVLTVEDRFLAKIRLPEDLENDCWIWIGGIYYTNCGCGPGYGTFYYEGKRQYAHRVAYKLWVGEIPLGHNILHKCDTPLCCSPFHIESGTQQQNITDKMNRKRHPNSKLTEGDVITIREMLSSGCSARKLAWEVGVSYQAILDIKHNRSWKPFS